jgi:hypothetical protein
LSKWVNGTWNNSWENNGGSGNYVLVLTAASKVTITFNPETNKPAVSIEVQPGQPDLPTLDYYLVGYINGKDCVT